MFFLDDETLMALASQPYFIFLYVFLDAYHNIKKIKESICCEKW